MHRQFQMLEIDATATVSISKFDPTHMSESWGTAEVRRRGLDVGEVPTTVV